MLQRKEVALTDATTTDAGEFSAIAATWSVDRQNEQIVKGAFEDTITAWRHQGRPVPVHWNHEGSAENVIGSVDPASMKETDAGLYVEGNLDLQDSETAREAWRSMKAGRIALSFGFLVTHDFKREDGVRELLGIDLYEVSLTPSPANPDTRIVSMKSAGSNGAFSDDDWAEMFGPARRKTQEQIDAEILEVAEGFEKQEAKAARPIQIKTFEC
jgi:uncharacterized protein